LSMEGEGHCLSGCACVPRKSNPAPLQETEGGKEEKSSTATTALASATKHLLHIEIDYGHHVLEHRAADKEIAITYDTRNGARWRTANRFDSGTFSAKIRTPAGNTSGLNCSFYLSSLEGDKTQDEIDFEFLGKDKSIIQTNVYTTGTGNREVIHDLGFDSSQEFHEYTICWTRDKITWYIDGAEIRTLEKVEAQDFPTKPMFLYASVWNAGDIDSGKWAGRYVGCNEPYVCTYKDVLIPDL